MSKVFEQFGELIKMVITGHQEAEDLKIGILSNFILNNK